MSSVSKKFMSFSPLKASFMLFQEGENKTMFFISDLIMYFANSLKSYHLSTHPKNIVSIFLFRVLIACIVLSGVVDIASS
jgi:hypothetical protein